MSNKTSQPSTSASYLPLVLMDQLQVSFNVFSLIFGCLGNGLVLLVIFNKKQRNTHDLFVSNLAIADILFIAFSFPGDIFKLLNWAPRSKIYCAAVRPLTTMFFCLGLFTITLMALYRCYVMINPYKPKLKKFAIYLSLLSLWLLAFVTSFPAIIVARVSPSGFCTGKWKSRSYKDAYIIFLFLIKCIIPLFLIILSYIRLGIFLIYNKPVAVTNAVSSQRDRIENIKIIRTIAFIVVLFTLCTLPYQVGWAMLQFGDDLIVKKAKVMLRLTRLIQNLHACINPVIYGISRKYFRQEYKRYLRKMCCLKNSRVNPDSNDDQTQYPRTLSLQHTHNLTLQVHNNNYNCD